VGIFAVSESVEDTQRSFLCVVHAESTLAERFRLLLLTILTAELGVI